MKNRRPISKRMLIVIALTIMSAGTIAFVLPSRLFPAQPRLTDAEYRRLFPFPGRYADLGDGKIIHYVDEGTGPTLLLLHGNPTSAFLYRHLIAELKSDFRVIAPDYPGFGKSTAPPGYGFTAAEQARTIVELFDRLELDRAVLMVQDWGGPIGFHLAQQRQENIRGLIIGNTWAWPLAGERRFELFSWVMGGPIGQGITDAHIGVVHLFLKRGVVTPLEDEAYAAYFQPFLDGDRRPVTTFPRELISATPFLQSIENNLKALSKLETLIVWGEKDFAFGSSFRERFEASFPDHRTLLLPNAGHFIQEDAPLEIAQAVRETFGRNLDGDAPLGPSATSFRIR